MVKRHQEAKQFELQLLVDKIHLQSAPVGEIPNDVRDVMTANPESRNQLMAVDVRLILWYMFLGYLLDFEFQFDMFGFFVSAPNSVAANAFAEEG